MFFFGFFEVFQIGLGCVFGRLGWSQLFENLLERVCMMFFVWFRMFWIVFFFEIVLDSSMLCEIDLVVFFCFGLNSRVFWAAHVVSGCFWLI